MGVRPFFCARWFAAPALGFGSRFQLAAPACVLCGLRAPLFAGPVIQLAAWLLTVSLPSGGLFVKNHAASLRCALRWPTAGGGIGAQLWCRTVGVRLRKFGRKNWPRDPSIGSWTVGVGRPPRGVRWSLQPAGCYDGFTCEQLCMWAGRAAERARAASPSGYRRPSQEGSI